MGELSRRGWACRMDDHVVWWLVSQTKKVGRYLLSQQPATSSNRGLALHVIGSLLRGSEYPNRAATMLPCEARTSGVA
jgi:hypothetical protein